MKILITGGKGYIARNLVPLFEQGGYEVLAPSRTEMDLLDEEATEEYIYNHQPSVLIHAATKGGRRTNKDTWDDVFVPNMKMWETISNILGGGHLSIQKVFVLGSGAEFDRRLHICNAYEDEQKWAWPMDPYGLSKSIITRQALANFQHTYVLRLFGCFNWDDDPSRFIKASILNLKRGLPIEIHQDKWMDYFFLDDIYTVIHQILTIGTSVRHMNLVYPEKITLLQIAQMIKKHMNLESATINVGVEERSFYTGSADAFMSTHMHKKLIGLEEGIRRTIQKLT